MVYLSGIINCLFLMSNPDTAESNWSSTLNMLGQFFFLILAFVIIIVLAVYSLRIASKFKNISGSNNNLRLIESKALGFNNFIHLVKVGDKYIIVGTSKTNVSYLTEIEEEKITDTFDNQNETRFDKMLNAGIEKLFNNKPPQQ